MGASSATTLPSFVATSSARPTPAPTPLPSGVLASIPLGDGAQAGDAPSVAVIGYGSVWVETHRGTMLYRIDPTTDQVVASIDLGQESCGEPAIGLGRVWIGPCDTSTKTIVVDEASNQVVGSINAMGGSMVFTKDAAWMAGPAGKLAKVDPSTYRVVGTYDPFRGGAVGDVVSAAGSIWASDEDEYTGNWGGEIAKIDPATGSAVSLLSVPDAGSYATMTADLGFIWVKGSDNDRLLRIDPTTGTITTITLPGFTGLSQMYDIWPATGLGSVWLRLSDGIVSRVDPMTGKVTGTYPADPQGAGGWPAVGFGSLWVPNFGSDTIWRVRIQG